MSRRALLFVVPLLTVAVVALGLRTGARDEATYAVVYGAPLPNGGSHLAWTLTTFRESSGVREVVSIPFHAHAESKGKVAEASGRTNEDGVAELSMDLPGLVEGDPLAWTVQGDDGAVLAKGTTAWGTSPRAETRALVAPTLREGDLDVVVLAWGARLATTHPGTLWIKAKDHLSGADVKLQSADVEPDPALTVNEPFRASCNQLAGSLRVTPNMHVAVLDLHVTSTEGKRGRFYASLPIAPGAFGVEVPARVEPGPLSVRIVGSNAGARAYVEVDDEKGRVLIAEELLRGEAGAPEARVTTPPLGPGLHWIVTSSDPDAMEKLGGATRAIPVRVGAGDDCDEPFSGRTPTVLPRFVAVDGLEAARIPARARKSSGRKIVLGAVGVGLTLELLLLATALRKDPLAKKVPRSRFVDAMTLVLLSALGFLLLFALLETQTR